MIADGQVITVTSEENAKLDNCPVQSKADEKKCNVNLLMKPSADK